MVNEGDECKKAHGIDTPGSLLSYNNRTLNYMLYNWNIHVSRKSIEQNNLG